MSFLNILDLVIGLFFIYFLFSVICTSVVEGFAQLMSWRSKQLSKWIMETFKENLGKAILNNKLIDGLSRKGREADYISAQLFSTALLDAIQQSVDQSDDLAMDLNQIETAVKSSPALAVVPGMRRFLLQALAEGRNTGENLVLLKNRIEEWYDEAMQRLIDTYKKRTRFYTLWVAFSVALLANVDTLALCKYLKDNPKAVASLVNSATTAVQDSILYRQTEARLASIQKKLDSVPDAAKDPAINDQINTTLEQLRRSKEQSDAIYLSLSAMGLPLGWDKSAWNSLCPPDSGDCFWRISSKILGILFTTLALTLGAPFWFDTINKLVNIRTSGNKPVEAKNDSGNKTAG